MHLVLPDLSTIYSSSLSCTPNYQHLPRSHNKMLSFLHSIIYYLIKCCRVLLCHSVLLPQGRSPLPALVTDISLFRTGPVQGQDINPLCVCSLCCTVPRRSASCLSGWGLVIELSVALFWLAISPLFFLSAPKSWPIYSNPIIIEAWLSGVIDGTLLEPGYC